MDNVKEFIGKLSFNDETDDTEMLRKILRMAMIMLTAATDLGLSAEDKLDKDENISLKALGSSAFIMTEHLREQLKRRGVEISFEDAVREMINLRTEADEAPEQSEETDQEEEVLANFQWKGEVH